MTNPFLSLAVLDTNLDFSGAKNPNPYCAQIRSQGSRRRICPLPVPSPVAGEGPTGQIAAYSGLRLGSVTFCASLLGKSQSLPPCGARKNLRAARLLDFFDRCGCSASLHPPLAVLGSASPSTATPSPPNLHNKSLLQFPSKIRYLCDLRPISSHNVNFPLKVVKY